MAPDSDRRSRKRAQLRAQISDTATRLFGERGFDAVSVTEIAEAADVARPTVFAYFPRKEDLVFDRFSAVSAALVTAIRDSEGSPTHALLEALSGARAPGGFGATISQQEPFWSLIAGSRVLQARARELAAELEHAVAGALHDRGVREAAICAALAAAAYRVVHLDAITGVLAGGDPVAVGARRSARLATAFAAVESAIGALQTSPPA